MPRTVTPAEDLEKFSVRLPPGIVKWLDQHATELGVLRTNIVRQIFEDSARWFGLPPNFARMLEADAKRHGQTQRAYCIDLLSKRCEELLREDLLRSKK